MPLPVGVADLVEVEVDADQGLVEVVEVEVRSRSVSDPCWLRLS